MNSGLSCALAAMMCCQADEETHRTANFVVSAANAEVARQVGEFAERYRRDLAERWLGKKSPDWSSPCRIDVTLSLERIEGVTSISFSSGKVSKQRIRVKGPLDRILKGPLPHELTHAIFAHYFGFQAPRWADEGGAILSEDEQQGARQSKTLRRIVAEERQIPLRRLLALRDYPADMECLYAQGHSVSRFLVDAKGHKSFLAFVREGLAEGWDEAARNQYGYDSVEHMEEAWLGSVDRQAMAMTAAGAEAR